MPVYIAFDMRISSEIALPELAAADGGPAPADVIVRTAPLAGPPDTAKQVAPNAWVGDGEIFLRIPETARFLVRGGREILVESAPGAPPENVRAYLLGSAFGALLMQRGYVALHGNGVLIDGKAVVCVGRSGAGKSTLAAGFGRRGFALLADDVLPVDAQARARAGYARIRLWRDSAEHLGIDTAGLPRAVARQDKFVMGTGAEPPGALYPVGAIYVLRGDQAGVDDITITPVTGPQRLRPLLRHTYRRRLYATPALRAQQMGVCGLLADRVPTALVDRPKGGFEIDRLIDALLADMAAVQAAP